MYDIAAQRFRNQGCGVVPSSGIDRSWDESLVQSRFRWAFWAVWQRCWGLTATLIVAGDSCGGGQR